MNYTQKQILLNMVLTGDKKYREPLLYLMMECMDNDLNKETEHNLRTHLQTQNQQLKESNEILHRQIEESRNRIRDLECTIYAATQKQLDQHNLELLLSRLTIDRTEKIAFIKMVRMFTGLGLKEAKNLVDQKVKLLVDFRKPEQEREMDILQNRAQALVE